MEGLQLWKTAFLAMAQSPRPGSPLRNSQFSTDKKQRNTHKINDKKIVIMPCKCAPSYQQIQSWLQAKDDYEYLKKRAVIKSIEIEKIDESLNNMSLPKNLCDQIVKVAVSSGIASKHAVQSEDLCFSSSNPTSPQTMEKFGVNISEMSTSTVKVKTVPLVTAAIDKDKKEEDCTNYSSPDSPGLPPWQQVVSTDSKQSNLEDSGGVLSSLEENKSVAEKEQKSVKKESKIPFCVSPLSKEPDGNSDTCFHSTPIREHISQGKPEALGCPLSGKPMTKEMQQLKLNSVSYCITYLLY